MTKSIAVDLHYFPNLEFFAAILGADELVFFPELRYQRQSFFNRTQIRLANKVGTLSVPIQGRRPRISQEKIKVDYDQSWVNIHLRGIQSAYGKAPFYEYYFPYFEKVFEKNIESLWELNWEMLTICLKLLGVPVKMRVQSSSQDQSYTDDIRGQLMPSVPFSERNFYTPESYFQLFGLDFDPNLSILDLLFCEGPASKGILLKSVKKQ
ncbi:WbqC-like protein [Algoriphagus ratkowskyi]|uniref:WbqC family protein n=1 Tax=Algoriphagus ratkowskyi TaxID=57028 RepID=A0A2W7RJ66_9BACT|nr:WbqC family protein [Algoriphagus ratkowskyi]PZX60434.1 WbqC-like protein [Algoriphagus ratkowskyi]TXD78243.1 WbqC family protein [Algoriphagus ratkowskyi]